MVNPDKIFGRLSNRMFMMAALYAYCRDNDYPIFVQDEKYFAKYKEEIKVQFSEGIVPNSVDRVAIHRRIGKNPVNPQEPAYSDNPFYFNLGHHQHEDLKDNYFMRAMALFPGAKFTVFSDDIERAKTEPMFQGWNGYDLDKATAEHQFEFSEGRNEVEDMNYMACHKGIIGSNSSFSWWGAYLSGADKVVFPKQWFASLENEKFIGIPKEWMRI